MQYTRRSFRHEVLDHMKSRWRFSGLRWWGYNPALAVPSFFSQSRGEYAKKIALVYFFKSVEKYVYISVATLSALPMLENEVIAA